MSDVGLAKNINQLIMFI